MRSVPELTINWHVIEACNYSCYFCYAKYGRKSRFHADYPLVLKELGALRQKPLNLLSGTFRAESIRVNFAGGEPLPRCHGGLRAAKMAHCVCEGERK